MAGRAEGRLACFPCLITIMAQSGPPDTAEQSGSQKPGGNPSARGLTILPPLALARLTGARYQAGSLPGRGGAGGPLPSQQLSLGPRPHPKQKARMRQLHGQAPGTSDHVFQHKLQD